MFQIEQKTTKMKCSATQGLNDVERMIEEYTNAFSSQIEINRQINLELLTSQ